MGTPHKQARGLTPPGRKSTLSGQKLDIQDHFSLPTPFCSLDPEKMEGHRLDIDDQRVPVWVKTLSTSRHVHAVTPADFLKLRGQHPQE